MQGHVCERSPFEHFSDIMIKINVVRVMLARHYLGQNRVSKMSEPAVSCFVWNSITVIDKFMNVCFYNFLLL